MHILQVGFLDWLRDLLLWIPKKIWEGILDALAALIAAIPVPDFVSSAAGWFGALPDGVVYFAQGLKIPQGLAIVVTAYVLRFIIRRLPIIG